MNKKGGVVEIPWVEAIGVALFVMLLVGTTWFFARLAGVTTGGGEERATEVAFRTMANEINILLKDESKCAAKKDGQMLFLADEYAIIGFNKGIISKGPLNNCDGKELVKKPLRPDCPTDKSCICLYKTQTTFNDKQPTQCVPINADYVGMPVYPAQYEDKSIALNMVGSITETNIVGGMQGLTRTPVTTIFIFGECSRWLTFDQNFGTKRMFLEKRKTEQGIEVLIANYDKQMETRYEECSKESQTEITA